MIKYFVFIIFLSSCALNDITGTNVRSSNETTVTTGQQGTVLVFLSARCPCSNSHVEEIRSLSQKYKSFSFAAIHSNANETIEEAKVYFDKKDLPFPVLIDINNKWANHYQAFKTPHAVVLDAQGGVIYQGGISNKRVFDQADQKYLRTTLEIIESKRKLASSKEEVMGCGIKRKHP